jgi:hypothetical protein
MKHNFCAAPVLCPFILPQAAEAHSDLAYWRTDPSALMAGDIDELEMLMVVPPAPAHTLGSVPVSGNDMGSPRASGKGQLSGATMQVMGAGGSDAQPSLHGASGNHV